MCVPGTNIYKKKIERKSVIPFFFSSSAWCVGVSLWYNLLFKWWMELLSNIKFHIHTSTPIVVSQWIHTFLHTTFCAIFFTLMLSIFIFKRMEFFFPPFLSSSITEDDNVYFHFFVCVCVKLLLPLLTHTIRIHFFGGKIIRTQTIQSVTKHLLLLFLAKYLNYVYGMV